MGEGQDLMEWEIEEQPVKGPEGTIVKISIDNIEEGDWLAVIYDDHWG